MTTSRRAQQAENIITWKERRVAIAEDNLERAIAQVEAARKALSNRQNDLAEAKAKHTI